MISNQIAIYIKDGNPLLFFLFFCRLILRSKINQPIYTFALIHGPNIPGSYAILLFTALDLASITVRTGHRTTDWFQIGKGVRQGCLLSPCLFNFNAEYIMRNAGLDEAQAGIKIAGRNINNFRYADDTTYGRK